MRRPAPISVSILILALAGALALAAWFGGTGTAPGEVDARGERQDAPGWAAGLTGSSRRGALGAGEAPEWDDAALIAALGRLGEVRDLLDPRLEQRAHPILSVPARITRTLELIQGRDLTSDLVNGPGPLSRAEGGAVLALGLAAATYGRPQGELPDRVRAIDRHAFVVALLKTLPVLRPAVAEQLVILIERLRLGGRPVLGTGFFQVVLELRRAHPELRELLERLLEECAAELPAQQRRAIASLFVNENEDAAMVRLAFAQVLASEGSHVFLELARERLGDEVTSEVIRRAILEAVASAAPTAEALALIAPHIDGESVGVLALLAGREGGTEVLIAAYDASLTGGLAGGLAAEERRWLVAGLGETGEQELLFDIARTDPDRTVRGQAMLSVSLNAERPSTELLEALLASRDRPDDPFIGLDAQHSSMALSNLALRAGRSGDFVLEGRAMNEMRAMVLSSDLTPSERHFALLNLEYLLPAAELSALKDQLETALAEDR